jgi:hypothetical protein
MIKEKTFEEGEKTDRWASKRRNNVMKRIIPSSGLLSGFRWFESDVLGLPTGSETSF